MINKSTLLAIAAVAAVLVACGGEDNGSTSVSGGTPPPAPTALVPDIASSSISAMLTYLIALVQVKNDNTDSPVDVSAFAPPVSNTTEPDPLVILQ